MKMKMWLIAVLTMVMVGLGCTGGQVINPDDQTVQNMLIEEAFDTFGYTLGMYAARDSVLKQRIEFYYTQMESQGVTATLVNEAFHFIKDESMVYQVLAYKMTRMIKLIGGTIDQNGVITDLGKLQDHYLAIIKNAYLVAYESTKGG